MAKKAGSKSRSSKARGEGGKAGRPPFEPVPPLWLAPDDTPPEERARQQAQYERDHAAWKERYDAWWRRRGPPESPAQTREASGRLPPGFLLSEPLPPSYLGPGPSSWRRESASVSDTSGSTPLGSASGRRCCGSNGWRRSSTPDSNAIARSAICFTAQSRQRRRLWSRRNKQSDPGVRGGSLTPAAIPPSPTSISSSLNMSGTP